MPRLRRSRKGHRLTPFPPLWRRSFWNSDSETKSRSSQARAKASARPPPPSTPRRRRSWTAGAWLGRDSRTTRLPTPVFRGGAMPRSPRRAPPAAPLRRLGESSPVFFPELANAGVPARSDFVREPPVLLRIIRRALSGPPPEPCHDLDDPLSLDRRLREAHGELEQVPRNSSLPGARIHHPLKPRWTRRTSRRAIFSARWPDCLWFGPRAPSSPHFPAATTSR